MSKRIKDSYNRCTPTLTPSRNTNDIASCSVRRERLVAGAMPNVKYPKNEFENSSTSCVIAYVESDSSGQHFFIVLTNGMKMLKFCFRSEHVAVSKTSIVSLVWQWSRIARESCAKKCTIRDRTSSANKKYESRAIEVLISRESRCWY